MPNSLEKIQKLLAENLKLEKLYHEKHQPSVLRKIKSNKKTIAIIRFRRLNKYITFKD